MTGNIQPKDAPTVQIETTGAFGQRYVKQVQLDSNRLKVKTESLQRFSNMIAIPSRGVYTDSILWALTTACFIRIPLSIAITGWIPMHVIGIFFAISAVFPVFAIASVFISIPDQRIDCFYRFCLINAGVAIATRFYFLV